MKHSLLILSLLATLFSCQKEETPDPEPGPAEHSLTRSLQLPSEGIRMDTTYSTQQIPAVARIGKFTAQQDYLFVEFGTGSPLSTNPHKDIVSFNIPVSKLRPGWVGDYAFVIGQFNGSTPVFTGDVMGSLYLRYYQKNVSVFDANGTISTPGVLRITAYDAKRHLLSGEFNTGDENGIVLTPLTTNYARYKLQLTGSFKNLPLVQ